MRLPFHELLDVGRLSAEPLLSSVECHETIGSTQDRAIELMRGSARPRLPLLVAAEEQTAGRGRGANRWWTARGSLAFTLVFDPSDWGAPRKPVPSRALAIGVAIVDTVGPLLAEHCCELPLGLHWPNDVYVGERKLAGILLDVMADGTHLVGIGLNVNNKFAEAPEDVRQRAISLVELTGTSFDRTALLLSLIGSVAATIRAAAADEHFGQRFDQLCLQKRRELIITSGDSRTRGTCQGIAVDGSLRMLTETGEQVFYSGTLG